jgi:hypothetical protein
MKVTFTCERCGYEFKSIETTAQYLSLPSDDCPNCAKLTYGPLTEEMMAEALQVKELAGIAHEARFVLRLLKLFPYVSYEPGHTGYWEIDTMTRDRLLKLARQP